MKRAAALVMLLCVAGCASPPPAPVEDRSSETRSGPAPRGYYRVHRGDTLYAIAFEHGLDYRELARWNSLDPPYVIYPGQELRLTAAASPAPRSPPRRSTGSPARVEPKAEPRPQPVPDSSTATPAVTASGSDSDRALPASSPSNWQWPVDGRVLRGFVPGDPSRNGLDIAAREGTPVRAAAAGRVVYSGSGLIGYGELVIVKHDEQWLSAYAHNRRRLVAEGESVDQGQQLAELGRNDRNEQVLHFEVRSHGKPVDPTKYLPKR